MFTLHEMNKKGLVHGDAHFGNILMDSLLPNEPSTAAYEFSDGAGVYIDAPQIPRIYDYDHSSVVALGPNPYLHQDHSRYRDIVFVLFICHQLGMKHASRMISGLNPQYMPKWAAWLWSHSDDNLERVLRVKSPEELIRKFAEAYGVVEAGTAVSAQKPKKTYRL